MRRTTPGTAAKLLTPNGAESGFERALDRAGPDVFSTRNCSHRAGGGVAASLAPRLAGDCHEDTVEEK